MRDGEGLATEEKPLVSPSRVRGQRTRPELWEIGKVRGKRPRTPPGSSLPNGVGRQIPREGAKNPPIPRPLARRQGLRKSRWSRETPASRIRAPETGTDGNELATAGRVFLEFVRGFETLGGLGRCVAIILG